MTTGSVVPVAERRVRWCLRRPLPRRNSIHADVSTRIIGAVRDCFASPPGDPPTRFPPVRACPHGRRAHGDGRFASPTPPLRPSLKPPGRTPSSGGRASACDAARREPSGVGRRAAWRSRPLRRDTTGPSRWIVLPLSDDGPNSERRYSRRELLDARTVRISVCRPGSARHRDAPSPRRARRADPSS